MRIVSKFHDFYDIGQGLGFDSSLDYIRTIKEVPLRGYDYRVESPEDKATRALNKKTPSMSSRWDRWLPTGTTYESRIIGFCGRLYPLIKVSVSGEKNKFFYSVHDLDKFMEKTLKKKDLAIYLNERGYSVRSFFKKVEEVTKVGEAFILNRSPIVVFSEYKDKESYAIWNARLRDYQFEKAVDPYQAFQQIEMFLSNLAVPLKPIPPRTDLEKRDSHGFDYWSFKKK